MRKYILAILLIVTGLLLLIYTYTINNKTKYSETLFSKEALAFDQNFTNFIKDVENNIGNVQSNFSDSTKIKDTINTRNFFFKYLNNSPYIVSILFFQNNYKVVTRKEENSLIYVIDSTEIPDILHWQRFEKEKLISSWQESLDESIRQTSWYRNLVKSNNQIQWFLRLKGEKNNENIKANELFYA